MSINSHIQIPNTILKNFRDISDREKQVWYLDFATEIIKKKPSGRLGTSRGYYSDNCEKYWSEIVEAPIGKLNQRVLAFCNGDISDITLSQKDMETIKRYMKAAMVRSNSTFEAMKKIVEPLDGHKRKHLNDAVSVIGMTIVDEIAKELDFENMIGTVLVNRTKRNFVVPRNCFFCVLRNKEPNYVMPISPKCALILLPKGQLLDETGNYGVIDSDIQILRLNKHALLYECIFNGAFVASNSRDELQVLQEFLNGQFF